MMSLRHLLVTSVIVLPGVITFVELFKLLSFPACVNRLLETSRKSISVIRSPRISDHWKERSLRMYAVITMGASLRIALYVAVMFLGFSVAFGLTGLLFYDSVREVMELSYRVETLVIAVVLGTLYALARAKLAASGQHGESDYGVVSRVLHHVALNYRAIKEMAFDIDCTAARSARRSLAPVSPVFVSGLARAGTTILLEALYATDAFTTLTYRDMPFVTAPYLWSRISSGYGQRAGAAKERAHGDRLWVDFDSPEAFEEVFWMTFSDPPFVGQDGLEPYEAGEELVENYRKYVGNIVARSAAGGAQRYLAKNNNNLLRIPAIRAAFPDATIIVPFRNPLDHASSLLNQHERFLERHETDPFSLKYMNWLGHFEFGANFKPFLFAAEAVPRDEEETRTLEYWLRYWRVVHEFILAHYTSDVVLLDYDELCRRPDDMLSRLESRLALDAGLLSRFSCNIKAATRHPSGAEKALSSQTEGTYQALKDASL